MEYQHDTVKQMIDSPELELCLCELCNRICKDFNDYRSHLDEYNHDGSISCSNCHKDGFQLMEYLLRHILVCCPERSSEQLEFGAVVKSIAKMERLNFSNIIKKYKREQFFLDGLALFCIDVRIFDLILYSKLTLKDLNDIILISNTNKLGKLITHFDNLKKRGLNPTTETVKIMENNANSCQNVLGTDRSAERLILLERDDKTLVHLLNIENDNTATPINSTMEKTEDIKNLNDVDEPEHHEIRSATKSGKKSTNFTLQINSTKNDVNSINNTKNKINSANNKREKISTKINFPLNDCVFNSDEFIIVDKLDDTKLEIKEIERIKNLMATKPSVQDLKSKFPFLEFFHDAEHNLLKKLYNEALSENIDDIEILNYKNLENSNDHSQNTQEKVSNTFKNTHNGPNTKASKNNSIFENERRVRLEWEAQYLRKLEPFYCESHFRKFSPLYKKKQQEIEMKNIDSETLKRIEEELKDLTYLGTYLTNYA